MEEEAPSRSSRELSERQGQPLDSYTPCPPALARSAGHHQASSNRRLQRLAGYRVVLSGQTEKQSRTDFSPPRWAAALSSLLHRRGPRCGCWWVPLEPRRRCGRTVLPFIGEHPGRAEGGTSCAPTTPARGPALVGCEPLHRRLSSAATCIRGCTRVGARTRWATLSKRWRRSSQRSSRLRHLQGSHPPFLTRACPFEAARTRRPSEPKRMAGGGH